MDAQTLVPAIFAILAFITVVGLGLPWLQPDIFKSRLKVINAKRGELSQQRRQRLDVQQPSSAPPRLGPRQFHARRAREAQHQEHHRAARPEEEAACGPATAARRRHHLHLPAPRAAAGPRAASPRCCCSARRTCTWRRCSRLAICMAALLFGYHAAGDPGVERDRQAAGRRSSRNFPTRSTSW